MPSETAESPVPARPVSRARRLARPAALVAACGVAAVALAGCTKPLPQVTFQSGSTSVLTAPTLYCFELSKDTCHSGTDTAKTLKATAGTSINISVPRTVADKAWIVTANEVGDDGKLSALTGAGSSLVRDNHHVSVQVPAEASGSYLLTVAEYDDNTPTGSWTIAVSVGS